MSDEMLCRTAIDAARSGGEVLQHWASRFTVREKGPANLVTEADFAAQEAIVGTIRARYPGHGFLGEEGLNNPPRGEPFRWIIDPLDGTSNYVHRFPYYAVSIGVEHEGRIVAGVVYDPNRNEIFAARQGHGATLNGEPIRPSAVPDLAHAFVVASLPPGVDAGDPSVIRLLRVLPRAQSLQRTGSAALNLAYVASGRMDAFWSGSLQPWDVAAGSLIVTEAGGAISRMDGRPFDPMISDLLCANGPTLHGELCDLLGGHDE